MENISDGLFTVQCDQCKTIFKAEDGKCQCGNSRGELSLDVDKMLDLLYSLPNNKGIDLVFEVFDHLYNKFNFMDLIFLKVTPSKLNGSVLYTLFIEGSRYDSKLINYQDFLERAEKSLKEKDYSDKDINDLVGRFRNKNNDKEYWESMNVLNAPEWLTGFNPTKK